MSNAFHDPKMTMKVIYHLCYHSVYVPSFYPRVEKERQSTKHKAQNAQYTIHEINKMKINDFINS